MASSSERDQAGSIADLVQALGALPSPVTIRYYGPDVESQATRADRNMLEAVAKAWPGVSLEVHAGRWDASAEAAVGIARTPAIVPIGRQDPGIRYYGTPDGYELPVFLELVRAVAEGRSGLGDAARSRLAALTHAVHLEALVAPT